MGHSAIKDKAMALIRQLPERKVQSAVDYLEYLQEKEEYDMKDVNGSVKRALKQVALIKKGKKKGKELKDLIDEL